MYDSNCDREKLGRDCQQLHQQIWVLEELIIEYEYGINATKRELMESINEIHHDLNFQFDQQDIKNQMNIQSDNNNERAASSNILQSTDSSSSLIDNIEKLRHRWKEMNCESLKDVKKNKR